MPARIVASSGFLAQARLAAIRLGCLCELSLKRQAPVLSESPSRSGEEVSPKREGVIVPLFLIRALA